MQDALQERPSAADATRLVGARGRVGGVGQEYEVVGMADATTVLVEVKTWDEPLRYPTAQVELDLAGVCSKDRFQSLVGQYRSIGPDGPEYEVVSIESPTRAKIWIVANEDNDDYDIEDILLDPIVYDPRDQR